MLDLKLIAGDFLYGDLPSGKEYLYFYFPSEIEYSLLSYYFLFGELCKKGMWPFARMFNDHSGYFCSERWVCKLLNRLFDIEKALEEANKVMDLEKIIKIKSGKYFGDSFMVKLYEKRIAEVSPKKKKKKKKKRSINK